MVFVSLFLALDMSLKDVVEEWCVATTIEGVSHAGTLTAKYLVADQLTSLFVSRRNKETVGEQTGHVCSEPAIATSKNSSSRREGDRVDHKTRFP